MQAPPIQASGVITTARDLRARCLILFLLLPVLSMVSFCKQIKNSAHVQYKTIIDSINTFRNAPTLDHETDHLPRPSKSLIRESKSGARTAFGRRMMRPADSGKI